MSYRSVDLTISPVFFEKHSKSVTVEPDDVVFRGSLSSGHPMDFSQNASTYRAFCNCTMLRDADPFLTEGAKALIEEQGLFSFAYLYNNENRSKHIRVFISTSHELSFRWVRCGNSTWPYLELVSFENMGPIGLVDFANSGLYTSYIYGVEQLGNKFSCSRFDIEKGAVKVVEYDKQKKAMVECKDKQFEIVDSAGFEMLESKFRLRVDV